MQSQQSCWYCNVYPLSNKRFKCPGTNTILSKWSVELASGHIPAYNIYIYVYMDTCIRHKCIYTDTKLYKYIYIYVAFMYLKCNEIHTSIESAPPMFFGCPVFLYEVVEVIVRPGPHCKVGRREYQRRNPRMCALQNGTTCYETIKQHGKNFKIRHYKTMSAMSQQKVNVFFVLV